MSMIETGPLAPQMKRGALPLDEAKKGAFEERMLSMINGAATVLMISVGHRTGLFDAMADLKPGTPARIAEAAGLNERYVREWLGAMVTGRVVDHDPEAGTYALSREYAACLTRDAAPNNLAAFAQYISVLGGVEDRIVECFREGGGVPYSAFGRFHAVMREDSGQTVLPALLDSILPLAPGLQDRLASGIDVLDLGCGSGLALLLMAEAYPRSHFVGYDFSSEAVGFAQSQARRRGLTNVRFAVKDVAAGVGEEAFDFITAFDAIHDQAAPRTVLANIRRALRPGGVFLMQDIAGSSHHHENLGHPMGPLLYTISCMHCMTVSLAAGGEGLGAMWGRQKAEELLDEAGFPAPVVHELPHDIQNYYYVLEI